MSRDVIFHLTGKKILKKHRIKKIIKLPENIFSEGITTSIFIIESGVAQDKNEIFTCYIDNDGLLTVKNQGRQDIKNNWKDIEDYWVGVISKQSGDASIKWIKPDECLSYQKDKNDVEINEIDFVKMMMDLKLYEEGIDLKKLHENISNKIIYSSEISLSNNTVSIKVGK